MAEDGVMVNLIPDFDSLQRDLDKGKVSTTVDLEGEAGGAGGRGGLMSALFGVEAGSDIASGGGQGAGLLGGMAGGGGIKAIAILGGILGGIMFMVNVLQGMPQITAMLELITKFVQLLLMPFVSMLFSFLKPVLVSLIRLMPAWLSFWKDPVGNLWELVKGIGEFIWNAITALPSLLIDALGMIGRGVQRGIGSTAQRAFNLPTQLGFGQRAPLPIPGTGAFLGGGIINWLSQQALGQISPELTINQTIDTTGLSQEAAREQINRQQRLSIEDLFTR